ncbi:hypothetical protein JG687_00015812 [Phytophthora cactorum]|uniref:Uncharacterized protein n=1 Tax=Phytophthora cactorum TaxID=29920 RepID=A0A8T1TV97_9STRA|nr:hypothetical protein GQ600_20790 [Phytophthora cactorum]KAG6947882.1 hypothetical protein JG687_00015812 [Phytophthora cactorum]
MHLLSLCLLYALGMKENTRDNGKTVVTPGSEFRSGCRVLQKLRNLTTFANATLRLAKLNQLKELYLLPAINISIDSKTRVGYAVTLLRHSVYNHFAFTMYSSEDWVLITELEALTDQLAHYFFSDGQKKSVPSSYSLLFRKMLTVTVDSESLDCLVLERPDRRGTEFTQRRVSRKVSDFSDGENDVVIAYESNCHFDFLFKT